jgi:predicted NBD/HSP70 family sugar kinase
MRRIDPSRFRVATQGTSREINRQIALNLVRAQQPISRADLARAMGVRRGTVTVIVNELLEQKLIFEGATAGAPVRGRKPTFLYIESRRRCIVAVDIRASQTYLMVTDLVGTPLSEVIGIPTEKDPAACVAKVATKIAALIAEQQGIDACEGIGLVVPGMVEYSTMRVLHAPTLGWRNVSLGEPLAAATGVPVHIENSGRACALAQLWTMRDEGAAPGDLVYVSVSDGLGVGVVVRGEALRGRHNIAGEFGHVPLSLDGPRCSCGASGCWEAYVSNRATLARYFGRAAEGGGPVPVEQQAFTVHDLIGRARGGDAKATATLQATARYLGLGLATIVNAIDPARIYIGGEITAAWDLVGDTIRTALAERVLTPSAASTPIRPVSPTEHPRLRGAAALVAAPAFAAPVVA